MVKKSQRTRRSFYHRSHLQFRNNHRIREWKRGTWRLLPNKSENRATSCAVKMSPPRTTITKDSTRTRRCAESWRTGPCNFKIPRTKSRRVSISWDWTLVATRATPFKQFTKSSHSGASAYPLTSQIMLARDQSSVVSWWSTANHQTRTITNLVAWSLSRPRARKRARECSQTWRKATWRRKIGQVTQTKKSIISRTRFRSHSSRTSKQTERICKN